MPEITDNTTPEHWNFEKETMNNDRTKFTVTHTGDDKNIVVKELPNGVAFRLQESANLPGGYSVLSHYAFDTTEEALTELKDRVREYEENGEWEIDIAPEN